MKLFNAIARRFEVHRRRRLLMREVASLAEAFALWRRDHGKPFGMRDHRVDCLEASSGPRRPEAAARVILTELADLQDELDGFDTK